MQESVSYAMSLRDCFGWQRKLTMSALLLEQTNMLITKR